ncbi:MAG TPA: thiol:disulfide interchange protein DsbG [Gammaproteobacteria bacterium]|nr:thiol:disulfide interchange protein DsbG [Gammaproteobacteria bacterium]
MKSRTSMLALACLLSAGAMLASSAVRARKALPPPIQALKARGIKIAGQFSAPDGLTGYAINYQGQAVAVYVTPDGKHAIVGTMIDSQGHNLSSAPLDRLITYPQNRKAWKELKQSNWIGYGSAKASRVVYLFIDPNCPYCHEFLREAKPWVRAGKVQIRNVVVAMLRPSSLPKAAAILSAKNPATALLHNQQHYGSGGIAPARQVSGKVRARIAANNRLMYSLGLQATPVIYYHDTDGHVASRQGLPPAGGLATIMGSPRPR